MRRMMVKNSAFKNTAKDVLIRTKLVGFHLPS